MGKAREDAFVAAGCRGGGVCEMISHGDDKSKQDAIGS